MNIMIDITTCRHAIYQIKKTFKKHYILTTAIIVILAMGMGVNITVFMTINAALFRPLPVSESHNLLSLYNYDIKSTQFGNISYPDYQDIVEYSSSFDDLLAYIPNQFKLKTRNSRAQITFGELVSDNYFDVLGVKPIIGSTFTDNIRNEGNYSSVVISYYFWKNRFNSDPDVVGTDLEINENLFTVIGVMPSRFSGIYFPGIPTQLWIPFSSVRVTDSVTLNEREKSSVLIVGRLRDNATLSQAQAEMDLRSQQLNKIYPSHSGNNRNYKLFQTNDIRIAPDPSAISIMRGVSLLLQTLTLTILLVVILNVSALFLVWGSGRKKEIAIIMAIGCTKRRIICQLLAENIIVSLIGGISGLFIAGFMTEFISNSIPTLPMGLEIVLDAPVDIRVVLFTFFLCLCTGIISGLIPAIKATNVEPAVLLAENDKKTVFKLKINRLYGIIVPQISISMLLLIPAGLLCNSFLKVRDVYQTPYVKHSAFVGIDFDFSGYSTEKKDKFLSMLAQESSKLQNVNFICFANGFPLSGGPRTPVMVEVNDKKQFGLVSNLHVSNGCFEIFGASLLHGRTFDEREDFSNSDAVIITESFAKKYWKTSNPLNQYIIIEESFEKLKTLTVIGIVKDVQSNPSRDVSDEFVFLPFSQNSSRAINIIGRGGSPAPLILDKLQRLIYDLDDNVVIFENSTMQQYANQRTYIIKALIAAFAMLGVSGMLLTCIGIYGLISYSIAQRRHEIGLRMAVGARRSDIVLMFLKEGLKVMIPGVLLGNIGTVLGVQILSKSSAMRFVSIFIPEISLWEPFIFIGASAIMGLGTMLACCIPALKIIFKDPMTLIKQV